MRRSELSEAASPGIIKYLTENVESLIFDKSTFLLVEVAVIRCSADTTTLMNAIIDLVKTEFTAGKKYENEKVSLGKHHFYSSAMRDM